LFELKVRKLTHLEAKAMKQFVSLVILTAFVGPALATDGFYVMQDVKTKKCSIVDKKPMSTDITGVGPVYKTREEAMIGMKTAKVCTSS
jgi:hypothetical protein